jgi:hypothetical protein
MIPKYSERSAEVEMHPEAHPVYTDDESGETWDECRCEFVPSIQAQYNFAGTHCVRVTLDTNDNFHSRPVWMTPNQAREFASYLVFAANDADTFNKDIPVDDN